MGDVYYEELPLSPFPLWSQELGEQKEEEERNMSITLYGPEWYGYKSAKRQQYWWEQE